MKENRNLLRVADRIGEMRHPPADLVWLDGRQVAGLLKYLLASEPHQLSLFSAVSVSHVLPADAIKGHLERLLPGLRITLRNTGHLFALVDSSNSQEFKSALDSVFGRSRFAAEFVLPDGNDRSTHNVIFAYAKTEEGRLHDVPDDSDIERLKPIYRHVDANTGRRYALTDCTRSRPMSEKHTYEWNRHVRTWRWPKQQMEELHAAGLLAYSKAGLPRRKRYLDEGRPTAAGTVWHQSFRGTPKSDSAVATRVLRLATASGDTVLDAFCTTASMLAAATSSGRRWIAVSPAHRDAARVRNQMRDMFGTRADTLYTFEGPRTRREVVALAKKSPFEFKSWALGQMGAVFVDRPREADAGIDGRLWVGVEAIPVFIKASGLGEGDVRQIQESVSSRRSKVAIVIFPTKGTGAFKRALSRNANMFLMQFERLLALDRVRLLHELVDHIRGSEAASPTRRVSVKRSWSA